MKICMPTRRAIVVSLISLSLILPTRSFCKVLLIAEKANINLILPSLLVATGLFILLLLLLWLYRLVVKLRIEAAQQKVDGIFWPEEQVSKLEANKIDNLLKNVGKRSGPIGKGVKSIALFVGLNLSASMAQAAEASSGKNILFSPGIAITITLILIPLIWAVWFACSRLAGLVRRLQRNRLKKELALLIAVAETNPGFHDQLIKRKAALEFRLNGHELSGRLPADDDKGLLHNIQEVNSFRFLASKSKAMRPYSIPYKLTRLILWYLSSATIWLLVGTTAGEYLGIKFVSPDTDHLSWLSFGRLRPVHTNMVFWGWSSLAMLGLGYYVVSRVSNNFQVNIRLGYWSLLLINSAILSGSLSLMAGINNGGGEYREYTWPVMLLFALGIGISLLNYIRVVADRKTGEIYISNWYIIAAMMFLSVIALVGYLPFWQGGLGETIVQGYYMHQAVGMWFMLFNLGLLYYFLPQQLNTPIYSYSLGILAFWAQILFYTLIGTHHFIFSSIPWWLQTIAIVGSMGMLIPVFAGTTNFLMTMRGNFSKVARSYTLPFYLVGIIFYFTGSTQGTAEAFRETNLVWHFTDFTTAHSHLTMYGIIAFMLWAFIYTLIPRLTGKEPKQHWVGAHFWLAFVGLLFYTIPLMIGGTLRGLLWQTDQPFIKSVVLMSPYWLWRAIGGTLMWVSHIIFGWNMYTMILRPSEEEIRDQVFQVLEHQPLITENLSTQA